jgi:hypothetical protein
VNPQEWLAFAVDIAAALAFFAMAFRLRSRSLLCVGLAFAAACAVMAEGLLHQAPGSIAVGYAIGVAASVAGFFALTLKFPPGPRR